MRSYDSQSTIMDATTAWVFRRIVQGKVTLKGIRCANLIVNESYLLPTKDPLGIDSLVYSGNRPTDPGLLCQQQESDQDNGDESNPCKSLFGSGETRSEVYKQASLPPVCRVDYSKIEELFSGILERKLGQMLGGQKRGLSESSQEEVSDVHQEEKHAKKSKQRKVGTVSRSSVLRS